MWHQTPTGQTARVGRIALASSILLWSGLTLEAASAQQTPPPPPSPPGQDATAAPNPPEAGTKDDDETSAPPLQVYEQIEVRDRADDLLGIATSAGEGVTGRIDLERRPILRAAELIETAPGVIATQHSGGGKANQYFLRGFNLDHGTDFSVWVDGVPVNMPSHGHGQGYADLNFLIPEIVDTVRYQKGPYRADTGDFSTAGSASMELVRSLPKATVSVTAGSDDYGRLLFADSFHAAAGGDFLVAVEGFHEDGPFDRGDDYEGFRGALRYTGGDAMRGWSLTAMGYDASWLATDQIPRRAVEEGLIDRFGLIDPGPRGETSRYSLSAEAHRGSDNSLQSLEAYLVSYDFGLYSNFTYFLDFPDRGDQFEQRDQRWVGGIEWSGSWSQRWGDRPVENRVGVAVRRDDIENGLFRTAQLERFLTVRQDSIELLGGAPWVENEVRWNGWFRTLAGLRWDFFSADVSSDDPLNSGDVDDAMVSPKLSLTFGPWKRTEVYLNLGYGFHSNDARGATLRVDPLTREPVRRVDPLVRTKGVDVGLRTTALPGLNTSLTAFQLELDSELIFAGDAGSTEVGRPSRRRGVEWSANYTASDRLGFELDATVTNGKFTDHDPVGDEIPGSIEDTIAAAIVCGDPKRLSGELRWRYFANVPLAEDGSVEWGSASSLNGRLQYRFGNGFQIAVDAFNLLDREDSDIEYFYASRLPGEPAEGVEDVHFHPMIPRSARLTLGWSW